METLKKFIHCPTIEIFKRVYYEILYNLYNTLLGDRFILICRMLSNMYSDTLILSSVTKTVYIFEERLESAVFIDIFHV